MPGEIASSQIGNMYTASIFMSLLSMLSHQLQNSNNIVGDKVGFISYGSGSKSKIFNGTVMKGWKEKFNLLISLIIYLIVKKFLLRVTKIYTQIKI